MGSLADRTITALRSTHDELAGVVAALSEGQLAGPSGASQWTVAQVLSHLGSGAEITSAGLRSALDGTETPDDDFSRGVWGRWDSMSPRDQATVFLEADTALVTLLEGLTTDRREALEVEIGFLPAPLPLASFAGMRLNEAVQHAWDVRVALDASAGLDSTSAELLVDHFTGGLGFLLGFMGKADQLAAPAVVQVGSCDLAIEIDDQVALSRSPGTVTATFTGEAEAVIRLVCGRLGTAYTPAGVAVTGNVTLDDLRRVFPGL